MSRTAPAHETASEGFSALLERLARQAGHAADARKEMAGDDQRGRSGKQLLAPVRFPAKKPQGASEAVPLSYEKALEKHARRRKSPDSKVGQSAEQPAKQAIKPVAMEQAAQGQAAGVNAAPDSNARKRRTRSAPERRVVASNKAQPGTATSGRSRSRHAKPRIKQGAVTAGTAAPQAPQARARVRGSSTTEVVKAGTSLSLEGQHSQALDHRRVIVSVRLSEEESAQLRQRAAESGISVSAYMRSCVLEADHLRTQVRQVLAQMRLYTKPPEPAQLSAISGAGSPWSRFLARSTTFLFGPWFPMRRQTEALSHGAGRGGATYGE